MGKAIFAFLLTILAGWVGMAVGHEILGGFPEFGTVLSVAVMGALIIFFNDRKQ
ncbi:MAG: binding-protein-dependent transport permease [Clostridiales bacterium]|nr:binding-protein-dependent transport permease [Clostridiales bacterium]